MILEQQLGNPQQPSACEAFPLPGFANVGLLGNQLGQWPSSQALSEFLIYPYWYRLTNEPGIKLTRLKQQKFTPEARDRRIAASLAALNAPQPIELSPAQWKEIVEEIEDIEEIED